MKNRSGISLHLVLAVVFGHMACLAGAAESPDGLWRDAESVPASKASLKPWVRPNVYRLVTLSPSALRVAIAAAPMEHTTEARSAPATITLPKPDGTFERFALVESPIMEEGLSRVIPEVKTYSGVGLDDPLSDLRCDWTPQGFHASVMGPEGTWFIDPFFVGDTELYSSYFRRDLGGDDDGWVCGTNDGDLVAREISAGERGGIGFFSDGRFRHYRLACAATGEYTAFHGGTRELAQAAIVTAINRLNQIYMREVLIVLILVANNINLMHTDAATDPYSPGATEPRLSPMLTQNQNRITSVIGSANYDIGHLFSAASLGGLASPGSVCNSDFKARAASTHTSPNDEYFYLRVAHEIGHQFNATHTFNSSATDDCLDNRSASSAVEPGSGSTIMSYGHTCGTDNFLCGPDFPFCLRDDYFSSMSISQVDAFVISNASCGTLFGQAIAAPMVNAGVDRFIPKSTPFTLTATGDMDTGMRWSWEQGDLGPAATLQTQDDGQIPLFRSFPPASTPSRTFPRMEVVLQNANVDPTYVERLPTVERTMRVWVLGNRRTLANHGWRIDTAFLRVAGSAGPFRVTAPIVLVQQLIFQVAWDVANTTAAPISTSNVRILLSTDGGQTFPTTLAASTPNVGGHTVATPPGISSSHCRVKIEAVGNVYFDVSDSDFVILRNDLFADAFILAGSTISTTGTNLFATKEIGEPNHVGSTGGASVWWKWTATESGPVRIDTNGSTFDTLLAIYTGNAFQGFTEVASNDDGGSGTQSELTFSAVAGTTYRIAVDGFNNGTFTQQGDIALNLAPGPTNLPDLLDDGESFRYFNPQVVSSGQSFNVGCRVRNGGLSTAPFFNVSFFASLDPVFTPSDYYLGAGQVLDLAPGSAKNCDLPTVFPNIPAGEYYIGWIIDSNGNVAELNESNNTAYKEEYRLVVEPPVLLPDLYDRGEVYRGFSPQSVPAGQTFFAAFDVENGGNAASNAYEVTFYASADTEISPSDEFLGSVSMMPLDAGRTDYCVLTTPFPTGISAGYYWIGWMIDSGNSVSESSEENNVAYKEGYQLLVEAGQSPVLFSIALDDCTSQRTFPPEPYVERGVIHVGGGCVDYYASDYFGTAIKSGWVAMSYLSDQLAAPPVMCTIALNDCTGMRTFPPEGYTEKGLIHVGDGCTNYYASDFLGNAIQSGWVAMSYRTDQLMDPPVIITVALDDCTTDGRFYPPTPYVERGLIHVGGGCENYYAEDFLGHSIKSGWVAMSYRANLIPRGAAASYHLYTPGSEQQLKRLRAPLAAATDGGAIFKVYMFSDELTSGQLIAATDLVPFEAGDTVADSGPCMIALEADRVYAIGIEWNGSAQISAAPVDRGADAASADGLMLGGIVLDRSVDGAQASVESFDTEANSPLDLTFAPLALWKRTTPVDPSHRE